MKEAASHAACLFHGFSDISRMRIVQHLLSGEHNVKQLTEHLGLAQTTVSGHLTCLLDCGVVQRRPVGRASFYSLTHPRQTLALLLAAQDLLAATGRAVTLCPRHGLRTIHEETEAVALGRCRRAGDSGTSASSDTPNGAGTSTPRSPRPEVAE